MRESLLLLLAAALLGGEAGFQGGDGVEFGDGVAE